MHGRAGSLQAGTLVGWLEGNAGKGVEGLLLEKQKWACQATKRSPLFEGCADLGCRREREVAASLAQVSAGACVQGMRLGTFGGPGAGKPTVVVAIRHVVYGRPGRRGRW